MSPIPLDEWHQRVAKHLDLIEAGAMMCARNARQLPLRPVDKTTAEASLEECEAALRNALIMIRRALAVYRGKPVEN